MRHRQQEKSNTLYPLGTPGKQWRVGVDLLVWLHSAPLNTSAYWRMLKRTHSESQYNSCVVCVASCLSTEHTVALRPQQTAQTGNSRIAWADRCIRGAAAEPGPPRSPCATGPTAARPARLSAAPPALPFALQPRPHRWLSGELDEHEHRSDSPTLQRPVCWERMRRYTRKCRRRCTDPKRGACLSVVGMRGERGFNCFRKPQGRL